VGETKEHVFGEAEPEFRCTLKAGFQPVHLGIVAFLVAFVALVVGAYKLSEFLPWIPSPLRVLAPLSVPVLLAAFVFWSDLGLLRRARPCGRFAFGEQIEVTLIEGWHALLSWGEVLSYRERGPGVELHTTRPPPRPHQVGLLPDLPQTLWVPTSDKEERARLLRLLKAKKIPRLR